MKGNIDTFKEPREILETTSGNTERQGRQVELEIERSISCLLVLRVEPLGH